MALTPEQIQALYVPQGPDYTTMMSALQNQPELIPHIMASMGVPPPSGELSNPMMQTASADPRLSLVGPDPFGARFNAGYNGTPSPSPNPVNPPSMGFKSAELPMRAPGDQGKPSPQTKDGYPPIEVGTPNTTKQAESTVPIPRPRPASAPSATTTPAQDALKNAGSFLSGVKAPASPEQQRIYSPSAPATKGVPMPDIAALITQMLGRGGANPLLLGQSLRF